MSACGAQGRGEETRIFLSYNKVIDQEPDHIKSDHLGETTHPHNGKKGGGTLKTRP